MKKFIIVSAVLLVVALVAVVAVFFLVNGYLRTGGSRVPPNATTTDATPKTATTTIPKTLEKVPEAGLPLSDLPLSEKQKTVVETVGINPDSFVITKDMVACAIDKIGEERVSALIAGGTPSALETAKLVPCVGR